MPEAASGPPRRSPHKHRSPRRVPGGGPDGQWPNIAILLMAGMVGPVTATVHDVVTLQLSSCFWVFGLRAGFGCIKLG